MTLITIINKNAEQLVLGYEGPFEVLLTAIRSGEINIFEVSIAEMTSAYFKYFKQLAAIDLNLSSEFLVMAAYLLELKSRKLLPQPEEVTLLLEEEEIESDLMKHLAEYQIFKHMAEHLKEKKENFGKIYSRYHREVLGPEEKDFFLTDVNLNDLVLAFQKVYKEFSEEERVVGIAAEEVTLNQRIDEVYAILSEASGEVEFERLFLRRTRLEVVVTFLAILELARQQKIRILQGEKFGGIILRFSKA